MLAPLPPRFYPSPLNVTPQPVVARGPSPAPLQLVPLPGFMLQAWFPPTRPGPLFPSFPLGVLLLDFWGLPASFVFWPPTCGCPRGCPSPFLFARPSRPVLLRLSAALARLALSGVLFSLCSGLGVVLPCCRFACWLGFWLLSIFPFRFPHLLLLWASPLCFLLSRPRGLFGGWSSLVRLSQVMSGSLCACGSRSSHSPLVPCAVRLPSPALSLVSYAWWHLFLSRPPSACVVCPRGFPPGLPLPVVTHGSLPGFAPLWRSPLVPCLPSAPPHLPPSRLFSFPVRLFWGVDPRTPSCCPPASRPGSPPCSRVRPSSVTPVRAVPQASALLCFGALSWSTLGSWAPLRPPVMLLAGSASLLRRGAVLGLLLPPCVPRLS